MDQDRTFSSVYLLLHESVRCFVRFVVERFPYSNLGASVSIWICRHITAALRNFHCKIGRCSKRGRAACTVHIIWHDSGKSIAFKRGMNKSVLSSFLLNFLFKMTGVGWVRKTNEKQRTSFRERCNRILCRRLCPGKIKAGRARPPNGCAIVNRTTRYLAVVSLFIS
jgi:hypothetical protein